MLTGLSCKCLLHDALPDMVPAEITRRWSKALIERSVCTAFTADSSSCFPADAGGHSSRTSSPNHRSLALIKPSKSCQCLSIDRAPSSRNPSPLRLGFTLCMNVTQKEPIREHVEPVRELPNISLAVPRASSLWRCFTSWNQERKNTKTFGATNTIHQQRPFLGQICMPAAWETKNNDEELATRIYPFTLMHSHLDAGVS